MWGEMELDKVAFALVVDQGVGVDTKALHHTIRSRDSAVGLCPHKHVCSFGVKELKVPKVIVGCLGLGDLVVRLGLARVDDIGKFQSILNEEHGDIVTVTVLAYSHPVRLRDRREIPNNVPIALFGVELDSKTTDISDSIGTTTTSEDCREAQEDRSSPRGIGQHTGGRDVGGTLEKLEGTMSCSTTSMYNSLGDALMIETVNLLARSMILKQGWSSLVLGRNSEPIVRIRLFYAVVGSDAIAWILVAVHYQLHVHHCEADYLLID